MRWILTSGSFDTIEETAAKMPIKFQHVEMSIRPFLGPRRPQQTETMGTGPAQTHAVRPCGSLPRHAGGGGVGCVAHAVEGPRSLPTLEEPEPQRQCPGGEGHPGVRGGPHLTGEQHRSQINLTTQSPHVSLVSCAEWRQSCGPHRRLCLLSSRISHGESQSAALCVATCQSGIWSISGHNLCTMRTNRPNKCSMFVHFCLVCWHGIAQVAAKYIPVVPAMVWSVTLTGVLTMQIDSLHPFSCHTTLDIPAPHYKTKRMAPQCALNLWQPNLQLKPHRPVTHT